MNWYFEKVREDDRTVEYRYSRVNKALDGRIIFDKKERNFDQLELCAEDKSEKPARERICRLLVMEKFYWVEEEGYPQEKRVFVT